MEDQLHSDVKSMNGKTVGEKYKIVNAIMRKALNLSYTQSEIDVLLQSCDYSDCTKIVLYISLVNFTKDSETVVRLLKSENDALVLRTIRICTFFFADKNNTPVFYISNIFPYLSYSNRIHLVNALAKNSSDEISAQIFFDDLKKVYGVATARPFLIHCNAAYIKNIAKHRVVLTLREIKTLFFQKPQSGLDYIQHVIALKKNDPKMARLLDCLDYAELTYITMISYTNNTLTLIEENKEWLFLKVFGRNTSKRILQANKAFVLNDSKYYSSILERSILYKSLSPQEYKIFYKGIFPKKLSDYDWIAKENTLSFLDYYKAKEEKIKLLLDTYASVYGKDLLADPKNISTEVLELLDVERRVQFAKEKLAKKEEHDVHKWISYLTCDEAIPKLKEEIRVIPDSTARGNYLAYMVQSCHINEDMSTLLEVMKYVNERHRNEQWNVKYNFLSKIHSDINLDHLTDKHWEQIKECIAVLIINKEIQYFYFEVGPFFTTHIKYNLEHDLPIEEPILNYLKWVATSGMGKTTAQNLFEENPAHEKRCLLAFGELMPKALQDEEDQGLLSFLCTVACWNKRHPADTMSVIDFVWAKEQTSTVFKSGKDSDIEQIVTQFVYDSKAVSYFADDLKKVHYKVSSSNLETTFKICPHLILTQIKEICEECCKQGFIKQFLMPLLKFGKTDTAGKMKDQLQKFCLKVMQDDKGIKLKSGAIRLLSYWLTADEFYPLVTPFFPQDIRVDPHIDDAADLFEIQKFIVYGLKNYRTCPDTFQALKKFCVGDYLKLSVGSLNSICVKSPLYQTISFLNSCIDSPVSFKKHIIRLLCLVCDKAFIMECLKNMWQMEKNSSIRQILLKNIYDNFSEEPNKGSWNLMKTSITTLTLKDKHSLNIISNLRNIHEEYMSEYVHITWVTLTKFEEEDFEFKSCKANVLTDIISLLPLISNNIIEELFREQIFRHNVDGRLQTGFCDLGAHYILQGSSTKIQEERMDLVLAEMKTSFDAFWNVADGEDELSYNTRESINYFVETMRTLSACDEKYKNHSECVLQMLILKLGLVFDPTLFIYSSYITIHLSVILKQSADLVVFGTNIGSLLNNEISANGPYIMQIFTNALNEFLSSAPEMNVLKVADGLLTDPLQSVECAYLVVNIVPMKDVFKLENKNIFDRLLKIDDRIIKILLNMYK